MMESNDMAHYQVVKRSFLSGLEKFIIQERTPIPSSLNVYSEWVETWTDTSYMFDTLSEANNKACDLIGAFKDVVVNPDKPVGG